MNGIPREHWRLWGDNDRDRAKCIIYFYYNPHLIIRTCLLLSIVVPIILIWKWYSVLTLVGACVWYIGVFEFVLRRIFICKLF